MCEKFNQPPARFEGTFLDGVNLRLLEEQRDRRGSFTEAYCDTWGLPIAPAQWSIVRSVAGTLRGMHLHLRHSEYFLCISGSACVGLYDLRPASPTKDESMLIHLSGIEPVAVSFPCGIAHGWLFLTDAIHCQAVSETYANYKEDDKPWRTLERSGAKPTVAGAPEGCFAEGERFRKFSGTTLEN
jgi:dTDP-4-dehydrorhamnose 3,5-epimerase